MSGEQPKGKVIMESISCREAAARLVLGASGVKEMHSVSGVRNGSVTLMAARRRVGRRKGKGGAAGRSGSAKGGLGLGMRRLGRRGSKEEGRAAAVRLNVGGSAEPCGEATPHCGRTAGPKMRTRNKKKLAPTDVAVKPCSLGRTGI